MRVQISGLLFLSGCATYITKPVDDTADTAAVGTDTGTDTGIDTEDSDTEDSDTDDTDTDTEDSDTEDSDTEDSGTGDSDTEDSDTGDSDTDEPEPLELPAELLDLSNWKLTLPTGDEGSPDEITQPELDTFSVDPYFMLDDDGSAVVFRADVDGVTTSGSSYPRSELREMDGTSKAAWSTTSGRHTMTITQAITHLPDVKQHVVAGQVHDSGDDVMMIRLEGSYLFVESNGDDMGELDDAYVLGTTFTVRIVAVSGWIEIYYEDMDTPMVIMEADTDGCYFKAGAYTQSNLDRGDEPGAYGEVRIEALEVVHE